MAQDLIDGLVFRDDDGRSMTTSLIVAEKFGKEHKNVLADIRNLGCSKEFAGLNFQPSDYIDPTGRTLPMYRMTRDGFMLLVMGFNGAPAMKRKEQFIAAFNAMENALIHGLTVWTKVDQILDKHVEIASKALTMSVLVSERMPVVEEKVEKISNRVERIEDAVDRLRPTLLRKQFADSTKELFRLADFKFYRGLCPCCQQIEIISPTGSILPIARYDHWTERNRNWPTDGWIVCHHCNQMLEKERHKHTAQFSLFQQRLEKLQGPADQLPIRGL